MNDDWMIGMEASDAYKVGYTRSVLELIEHALTHPATDRVAIAVALEHARRGLAAINYEQPEKEKAA